MRTKHLLSVLCSLFLFQCTMAQQMKPADGALRERLVKYAADNHLPPGGNYVYFDTASKRPLRFVTGSFLTEDAASGSPVVSALGKGNTGQAFGPSGNFHLVKDVNTSTDANPADNDYFAPDNAQHFAVLNDVAYFSADDGIHGAELWRSDGTAAGTYLVKDIFPSETSSNPFYLFALAGKLYFSLFDNALQKAELWVSDGTADGTIEITPDGSPFLGGFPSSFCEVNGTVYFTGNAGTFTHPYYNSKLWKTDGTKAGTTVVKDLSANNTTTAGLHNLVAANGLLFFVAYSNTTGNELYRSDGTDAGTYLVKDIYPGAGYGGTAPSQLTAYAGKLYFEANNSGGSRLWVSDGTANGTTLATGYNGVQLNTYGYNTFGTNQSFVVSNNVLYFPGYTPTTGWELYKYDAASPEGVVAVDDITPGSDGYIIPYTTMADVDGTVFFLYSDASGNHLYKTNGSVASTVLVKEFDTASVYSFYNGNGRLYFKVYTPGGGLEPWSSDGTTAGTSEVADINPGSFSSGPQFYTPLRKGGVLFAASDNVHGHELYIGYTNTATLVKDINITTTSGSFPTYLLPLNGGVFANASTPSTGAEPWFATTSNENLLKDLVPGENGSNPTAFTAKGNAVYFIAGVDTSYAGYYAIYKTDGTTAGTIKMTPNIQGGIAGFTITDDGTLYYSFYRSSNGTYPYELWRTDGTAAGTKQVYVFASIWGDYDFHTKINTAFTSIGNTVYLSAAGSGSGIELWKSDGTTAGTTLVKDIYPGTSGSTPQHLTVFNNRLCFSAFDTTGYGLWQSDGTETGTTKLTDGITENLTVSGNNLFFILSSNAGEELWKTDGTTAGTSVLKNIVSGTNSAYSLILTDVNGTLFFPAYDSESNTNLWKSDGTANGTVIISKIGQNIGVSSYTAASNNKFFFIASSRLWVSDGTATGTGQINDDILNNLSIFQIAASGNQVFVNGSSYKYGYELYAGDATQVVLPVTLVSFGAALKGSDVIAQWQTASEVNTSYFNVQRSTDGVHFTDAGKVMAKGSGTYSYTDVNVANLVSVKTLYYRLQTVDKDGSTAFSKVVPIDLKLKDAVVLLLPNPVKDALTIRVNNYNGKASISLFDANGKNVYTTQKAMQSGSDITINTTALQSGVYLVKMNLDGKVIQQKFIKE